MKKASTHLFDLIKMMSASERRYFQKYAQRHSNHHDNQYLQLFHAISTMQEYDEAELKEVLKDTTIVAHFAVTKRYLYEQVLDSLHHYHLNQQLEEKILKDMHLCKILLEKNLTQQAEKRINKCSKLIEKHQLWAHSLLLLPLKRKLMRTKRQYNQELLVASEKDCNDRLERLQKENFYWLKTQEIIGVHLQKIKLQDKEQEERLEQVVQELLAAGLPQTARVQIDYLKALATFHFMKGEVAIAAKYNRKLLQLFEKETQLMYSKKGQYIASFKNYLIDNHILGRHKALEEGVGKLRVLSKNKIFRTIPDIELRVFELTYSLQLNTRIQQNQFAAALTLLPELKDLIKKYKEKIAVNYQLSFGYLMAYIYYGTKNYRQSLGQLELLKNSPNKKLMQELQYAADRLLLINHLALGNYRLLESLIENTRRNHRQKAMNTVLGDVFFKGLKKTISAPDTRTRQEGFDQMKRKILAIKQEEIRAWNYFNFDAWELNGMA